MAAGRLKRTINVLAVIASALLWLTALIWFAQTAQNSETLSRLQNGILLFSFIGIVNLMLMIVANLTHLVLDYRNHLPVARLDARMVV